MPKYKESEHINAEKKLNQSSPTSKRTAVINNHSWYHKKEMRRIPPHDRRSGNNPSARVLFIRNDGVKHKHGEK